jgi:ureidoglycolate hydrolase
VARRVDERHRKNHPDKIAYLERHNETDEAFILLDGRCTLIFCTSPDQPDALSFCEMEKGKVYNVKMGTWHTNLLYEGSKVLIVENLNTSKENSSYFYDLSEAQKEFILKSSI